MKKVTGIITILFLVGCYTPSNMNYNNIASNYQNQARNLDINAFVYHLNSDTSRIYYQFIPGALFYQNDMKKNVFYATYKIKYEIYNIKETKKIVDSLSFTRVDSLHYKTNTYLTDSIDIPLKDAHNYIIGFTIVDLNKKFTTTNYINVDKTSSLSRNNYHLRDENNVPLLKTYIGKNQKFRLVMRDNQIYRLFVKYYKKNFPIADPPFSHSSMKPSIVKPDSVFMIEMNNGRSDFLCFVKTGMYHIQSDTSKKEGYTILRFYDDYPYIKNPEQMLYPIRYITSKNEYNDLVMMKNTKLAIDNFWLDKAGNPDRAKEMIKEYYTRVQDANRFFTSYHEGWKTDRGMIYIVFGPPQSVYRSPVMETWYYGEDRNILSMTMNFYKTDNPFTDNDYTLDRSDEYKDVWYTAVETWRR